MEKILGYDYADGKYIINETESEMVKFIIDQYLHYGEEPPSNLLRSYMRRIGNMILIILWKWQKRMRRVTAASFITLNVM